MNAKAPRDVAPDATPGGSALLRGAVVYTTADETPHFRSDAVLDIRGGRVHACRAPQRGDPPATELLFVPGLVDLHCHWPQGHVRGRFAGQLLPWLREHIWPAEAAFSEPGEAAARADAFVADLLRCGTTAGLFFGPPFLEASRRFLEVAPHGCFDGPALMETHCPESMQRPAAEVLAEVATLPAHERRRVAVSPRFAPNLHAEGLRAAGAFARTHGLLAQSHLSENRDEIAWVAELFPERESYTDVYDHAGLLGPHVVMAHGVHLGDAELARLAETRTLVAHCPTSNEALSSGRMPVERLRAAGVPWVLATDVGAGPQLSQLHVMASFLSVHAAANVPVSAVEALARASAIPGAWLAEHDASLAGLGTLVSGAPAHVVALPHPGGSDAESVLRRLLAAEAPDFERAARAVWVWGTKVAR